jgi:uncharacterized membrane protein YwzB
MYLGLQSQKVSNQSHNIEVTQGWILKIFFGFLTFILSNFLVRTLQYLKK